MSSLNKHSEQASVGFSALLLKDGLNKCNVDQINEVECRDTMFHMLANPSSSQPRESSNLEEEEVAHDRKRRRLESLEKSSREDNNKYDISYRDLDKWLGTMVAGSDVKNQPLVASRRSSITSVTSFSEQSQNTDVDIDVYVSECFVWSATQVELFPSEQSNTNIDQDKMHCFREEALLSYQKKIGIISDSEAHSTSDPSLNSAAHLSSTCEERNHGIPASTSTKCYHKKQKTGYSEHRKDQQEHMMRKSLPQVGEEAACVMSNLTQIMSTSQRSEHALLEWDRKMGLRRNHCRTMGATSKSRKRLNEMYSSTSLQKQSFAKGA